MPEQIISKTVTKYECPICHTEYDDEATALRCASRISELDKQVAEFKLWHWYRIEHANGSKIMILPYKVCRDKSYPISSCIEDWHLLIHDSQTTAIFSDYFWEIFEGPISLEEAWEKYRICPDFERTLKMTDIPSKVLERLEKLKSSVSFTIYKDIWELEEDTRDYLLARCVESVVMNGDVRPYKGIRETLFNPQIDKEFERT